VKVHSNGLAIWLLRVEVEDLEGEQSLEAIRLGHIDLAVP